MKSFWLILVSILITSCATDRLHKFGKKKLYSTKIYRMNGNQAIQESWVAFTKDYNQTCFDDNPENKEIMTVPHTELDFAILHYHKRLSRLDIVNTSYNNGAAHHMQVKHTDDLNFDVEVAHCYFENVGGLFEIHNVIYSSFRLASKREK
jgi:hypothetical protein